MVLKKNCQTTKIFQIPRFENFFTWFFKLKKKFNLIFFKFLFCFLSEISESNLFHGHITVITFFFFNFDQVNKWGYRAETNCMVMEPNAQMMESISDLLAWSPPVAPPGQAYSIHGHIGYMPSTRQRPKSQREGNISLQNCISTAGTNFRFPGCLSACLFNHPLTHFLSLYSGIANRLMIAAIWRLFQTKTFFPL